MMLERHIAAALQEEKEKFKELEKARISFNHSIPADWKDSLRQEFYGKLRRTTDALTRKLDRKLKNVIDSSDWTNGARNDCFINLSSKQISENVSALGYSLSFFTSNRPSALMIASFLCIFQKHCDLP